MRDEQGGAVKVDVFAQSQAVGSSGLEAIEQEEEEE